MLFFSLAFLGIFGAIFFAGFRNRIAGARIGRPEFDVPKNLYPGASLPVKIALKPGSITRLNGIFATFRFIPPPAEFFLNTSAKIAGFLYGTGGRIPQDYSLVIGCHRYV